MDEPSLPQVIALVADEPETTRPLAIVLRSTGRRVRSVAAEAPDLEEQLAGAQLVLVFPGSGEPHWAGLLARVHAAAARAGIRVVELSPWWGGRRTSPTEEENSGDA